jgi:hypothetical protein
MDVRPEDEALIARREAIDVSNWLLLSAVLKIVLGEVAPDRRAALKADVLKSLAGDPIPNEAFARRRIEEAFSSDWPPQRVRE